MALVNIPHTRWSFHLVRAPFDQSPLHFIRFGNRQQREAGSPLCSPCLDLWDTLPRDLRTTEITEIAEKDVGWL